MGEGLRVLCLNSGSSSLKLDLWSMAEVESLHATAAIDAIGGGRGQLRLQDGQGHVLQQRAREFGDHGQAALALFDALRDARLPEPHAIGHRIVHGGVEHAAPTRVSPQLLSALRSSIAFAPLHLPAEISGIEAALERFGALPQVVCFDTAFHRSMPRVAQRLPLPRKLFDQGIQRYGFHGLSYEYIVSELGDAARARVVIAHLGSGASLCAVRDGRALDTSMSFSPTGGVMMATRPGDLDPEVVLHLLRAGYQLDALDRLVNRESGLLGVSGLSADMRSLLEARVHDAHAAEAVEMFCQSVKKQIGALTAVLGGLDLLVFTGGIGERAAPIRDAICQGLAHLGIQLDLRANQANDGMISAPGSACSVRVIATDENLMIARHTRKLLEPLTEQTIHREER